MATKQSKFEGLTSLRADGGKKQPTASRPQKKKGKRGNPDYTQISAYVKKDTHRAVMREIVTRMDLSDLIEELFTEWLKKQK